jgi:hypothetical protein
MSAIFYPAAGLLLFAMTTVQPAPAEPAISQDRQIDRLHPGMTADEVRRLTGRPSRTARQILYRRYLEQWFWDDQPGLRLDWDCRKGEDPRLVRIHRPDKRP